MIYFGLELSLKIVQSEGTSYRGLHNKGLMCIIRNGEARRPCQVFLRDTFTLDDEAYDTIKIAKDE